MQHWLKLLEFSGVVRSSTGVDGVWRRSLFRRSQMFAVNDESEHGKTLSYPDFLEVKPGAFIVLCFS